MPSKPGSGGSAKLCPICGKPAVEKYAPFDSKRCADIDLHHWLTGRYAIPAEEADDMSEGGEVDVADSDESNGTVH